MRRLIFWDTSAFIALMNSRDLLHEPAVGISQQLAAEHAHVLTTSSVLVEVANGLNKVHIRTAAQRIIDSVRSSAVSGVTMLVHVDPDLWQRGWDLYCTRHDKECSLTDCITFVVMQQFDVRVAFTSDHHFQQAGFVRLMQA